MNKQKLTVKFIYMFSAFTLLTLAVTSVLSYINQNHIYKSQKEESIQNVASYLETVLAADGQDFIWYQEHFMENCENLLVPLNFTDEDIQLSRMNYEKLFKEKYPNKILGQTIEFNELDEETKNAYTVYKHEYYLTKFEKARKNFSLIYVEYMVPPAKQEEIPHITYVLDSMREEKIDNGQSYINLGITVPQPLEDHQKEWEAWNTGVRPTGYDTFDNEYGKTFAFYTPFYIGDKKLGIIGCEVEIATVNKKILDATIQQMLIISIVLIIFVSILLNLIRRNYIRKLEILKNTIEDYSTSKNPDLAKTLLLENTNQDEISEIMKKFSEMIKELDSYMQNLSKTKRHLQDTQQKAMEMSMLAIKDPLTGIRNKTGYDKEVMKIKAEIASESTEIGIAMVDLNFLKKINDNYGHDKGNITIITLCQIICKVFDHSPVFRIGGDEFVIVLRGQDLKYIDDLIEAFYLMLDELQAKEDLQHWEKPSAAIGYAIYDPDIDKDYEGLFKRADDAMYSFKKEMKALRQD
ncbi:MAG: diguanylate cyclase [Treponema sp.]|nr:diguanylate cyclase [Treponema sp.]